jgi:hypothetical protein
MKSKQQQPPAHRPTCLHRWEERERTSGGVVAEERNKEGRRKRKNKKERKKEKEKKGKENINELFVFINCDL